MCGAADHYHRAERIRECATVIESTGGTISELIDALQSIKSYIILPFSPHASDMVLDGQVTDVLSRMDVGFHNQVAAADPAVAKNKAESTNNKATNGTPLRNRMASLASSKVGNSRLGVKESQAGPTPNGSLHGASVLERKLSRAMLSYRSEAQLAEQPHLANPVAAQATVPIPVAVVPAGNGLNGRGNGSLQPPNAAMPIDATCAVTLSPRASTATPVTTPKKPIKWLAFLSHHKQDGGDAQGN